MVYTGKSQFLADLQEPIRLSDARKASNASRRAQARANPELCAILLVDAQRMGHLRIDWNEFFRNTHMI